jgi:tetratricopeptide (TPR) repeat protein
MTRPEPRRRLPGVDVDPSSIRQARLAAGLSLSEVAGSDLTRAAVHRVEKGQVRPSMRTLELIAERTGTPVDVFLARPATSGGTATREVETEDALYLARLERMCIEGRYAEVVATVEQRLPGAQPPVRARLHHLAGAARVQLLEPALALVHLRRARLEFEQAGDAQMAVECKGWETAALSMEEDPTASQLAQEALRNCQDLDPVPTLTQARILGHLAGVHLSRHEWERAISTYQAAVEAAAPVRELNAMSSMYEGLSIAYQGLGDLATATAYAQKALALSSVTANRLFLARIENNIGVLLIRTEQWDAAGEHLRRALELCEQDGTEQGKSHVLLSLGQLAFAQGDHGEAESFVRQAIEMATTLCETMTEALGQEWLGRILAAAGRDGEADAAFARAFSHLEGQQAPRRLAECHHQYAEVLQRRGDLQRSVMHWQRAAQLWQPVVDAVSASQWMDSRGIAN